MKLNYTCEDYKTLLSKPRAVIEDEETLEGAFVIPKGDYYLIKALAEDRTSPPPPIDEAFPFIERSGLRIYEAEVHRLKGELLLAQDASNAAQAEQSFRTAIDIARKQHARFRSLRSLKNSLPKIQRSTPIFALRREQL